MLLFRVCPFGFGGSKHSRTGESDESECPDDEVQSLGVADTDDAIQLIERCYITSLLFAFLAVRPLRTPLRQIRTE